ncbi:MAG: NAD(P)H-quinone oxidoreductase [Sphingomonas bacterium]|nr:NAD(P)H-quinone oxidoreductase [Sphingomonas bacterium]
MDASVDRGESRVNNDAMSPGTIPTTMRAIDPEAPGGPEVLRIVERPVPIPGEGEVLIKVAAAGINRPELLQRQGAYPPPPGAPSILGLEVAGTVVATGDGVERDLVGQPVCALIAGGGYADYAVAPHGQCLPVPHALTMVEAAAMPETLFTVWTNMFERGFAAEGDTVLVHGGTSGIGAMAIGLCNLFGVTIIVTAGSDDKCAAAKAIGADHAINYKTQDFVAEVKAITGGKGVAVVLDMVGGDYVARNLQCLADDGRHVSIAVQGGPMATIPVFEIMRRRLTLTGSTLRPRSVEFKTAVADELAQTVWPLVAEGKLKPVIDRTYQLAEAPDAHRRMEAGDHVGKIVLVME